LLAISFTNINSLAVIGHISMLHYCISISNKGVWLAWREMIRPQAARRPPAAQRPQCVVKWDRNLKPKLAIMRQCTSVTDGRTGIMT